MNTFEFDGSKVFTVIDKDSNVWFKAYDVANILGYVNTSKAIQDHVDADDKLVRGTFSNPNESGGLIKNEKNQIMINESGMYSLVLRSKLDSAKAFKRWITSEVLPSIRKTGKFKLDHNKPVKQNLMFKIENEFDLHIKVINFIKNFYPSCLMTVCNAEYSNDNAEKRIKCNQLGYVAGTFDLIINNLHKSFNGFAIEFKSPSGKGVISPKQADMKTQYLANNFKVLISNNYDEIITEIIEYMRDTRVKCQHCIGKFKTLKTLNNHCRWIHRIHLKRT